MKPLVTMLPQRKDQPLTSAPVSRIALSSKLNQLAQVGSRPSSRPATPASYITSSLNPTRNMPQTSSNLPSGFTTPDGLEQFDDLPIAHSLREYETTFAQLSQSISSFKEEDIQHHVERLIQTDKDVKAGLDQLEVHQKLGKEVKQLQEQNDHLKDLSTHILKELISCRAELKKLPRLPAAKEKGDSALDMREVGVQELLDYSMKLAKFSKAPATVTGQLPHPNNFIWPAEDALRRGMLAMASLKPDEILKAELGEEAFLAQHSKEEEKQNEVPQKDVEMKDAEEAATERPTETHVAEDLDSDILDDDQPQAPAAPTAASAAPATSGNADKPAQQSNTLDLDLFDPDEDDDSD